MKEQNFIVDDTQRFPIKAWTRGVQVEDSARQQLRNLAAMPFIHSHVAAMPDVHWGMGATVGSVIATKAAIIPAAVGVDLGCGMMAVETTLRADQLPDTLQHIRGEIERAVPCGRTNNGSQGDRGAWTNTPARVANVWSTQLMPEFDLLCEKHPVLRKTNNLNHLGTLGTGNHFIEICLDERDTVWVMLHSGSRGVGNRIGMHFIELAKKDMQRHFINLPDVDLSYLVEGTQHFDEYVEAVGWAQKYAMLNRQVMMDRVMEVLRKLLPPFQMGKQAVNCHHNYVERENHFGANVWVTRKGAVRAREGDLGIIPGSMGTGSFIVRGKGNPHSFCSCSHGAGRAMSRGEARRRITLEDHAKAMEGIEARLDEDVLDESPAAYKDISAVMAAQDDLIEIVHRLRQVVNVKG